jgi:hypothetical protein
MRVIGAAIGAGTSTALALVVTGALGFSNVPPLVVSNHESAGFPEQSGQELLPSRVGQDVFPTRVNVQRSRSRLASTIGADRDARADHIHGERSS